MTASAMTLRSAIAHARATLRSAALPDTDTDREAEALACFAACVSREEALAHGDRPLDAAALARLHNALARRVAHEPLAYILGTAPFLGRSFTVTPAALIPRPATETLVEAALRCARSFAPRGSGLALADVGTGSGCIAVTLAAELPGARVVATDLSEAALTVARGNAAQHGVAERTRFVLLNGIGEPGALPELVEEAAEGSAIIVANLPYIPVGMLPKLAPGLRHEPQTALVSGEDGLDAYRVLLGQVAALIAAATAAGASRAGIRLFMECLPEQAGALLALAQSAGARAADGNLDAPTEPTHIQNDANVTIGVSCIVA